MAKAKKKKALKKKPVAAAKPSIDNEDDVVKEMAKALDYDVGSLKIEAERGDVQPMWFVYTSPQSGEHRLGQEYHVVANYEAAVELAEADVKQRLQDDGAEYFNKDFLQRHIDLKNLGKQLHEDVEASTRENLTGMEPNDFWEMAEGSNLVMYIPEDDEDGEKRPPTNEELEDLIESETAGILENPIEYLENIYGKEDAVKQAIEIGGIDVDAAAVEAVRDDGPGNFLNTYDNETYETPAGFVYWRSN